MRKPKRLPDALIDVPFGRAEAASAGVPQSRLRRRDLVSPFHGVRSTYVPGTTKERCAVYAVRLRPGQAFSHLTAARLHGVALPPRIEHRVALDVAAVEPAAPPNTRGVIGHRLRAQPETELLDGLPVCTLHETWCQLAGLLSLEDLVVIADQILRRAATEAGERGEDPDAAAFAAAERLHAAIERPGRYRTRVLRQASRLARWRSASPGETRTRVLFVTSGLPEPELNQSVHDDAGAWLGIPDMVWRGARVAVEYEGDHHRSDKRQWRTDVRRYEDFQAAGWAVIRVTAEDLRPENRPGLIARVRRVLA